MEFPEATSTVDILLFPNVENSTLYNTEKKQSNNNKRRKTDISLTVQHLFLSYFINSSSVSSYSSVCRVQVGKKR